MQLHQKLITDTSNRPITMDDADKNLVAAKNAAAEFLGVYLRFDLTIDELKNRRRGHYANGDISLVRACDRHIRELQAARTACLQKAREASAIENSAYGY